MIIAYFIIAVAVACVVTAFTAWEKACEPAEYVAAGLLGVLSGAAWPLLVACAILGLFARLCEMAYEWVRYR